MPTTDDPMGVVHALRDAINAHDIDALSRCFAADFQSELPTFPDASFRGNENVRQNWSRIFQAVPDISADVVRSTTDGESAWIEWEQRGTLRDGRPHLARGMIVFAVRDGQIASNRFYVHPVRSGPPNVLEG